MKPKTKKQREIMSLVPKLTPISNRQIEYAEKYLFNHYAYKNGNAAYCMTCGNKLTKKELEEGKCSCCKNSLLTVETKKRKESEVRYYAIVSKCNKYQVIRYYYVKRSMVRKKHSECMFIPVAQEWIDGKGGKPTYVARLALMNSYYSNNIYSLWSDMEIRTKRHVSESITYPKINLIPIIKRNLGDNVKEVCNLKSLSISGVFYLVMNFPHAETLVKAKQYELFNEYKRNGFIDNYWNVVKICIRNNYIVSDFDIWKDMIEAIEYCGGDISNGKNVCPENLLESHDYWVNRMEKIKDKRQKMQDDERAKQYEDEYKKQKGKWFAIAIEAKGLSIKVLDSVKKFIDENNAMHHCVFANEYYKKKNSLIMSVTENGNRVATIEYDISKFKVLQCRGVCNQVPAHYDEILSIMDNHIKMFRKIAKSA